LATSQSAFAGILTFTTSEPLTITIDGYVITTKFGGIMQARTLNINGEKASLPTQELNINNELSLDLGGIVNGIQFESIKAVTQTGEVFTFNGAPLSTTQLGLPKIINFYRNAENSLSVRTR